MNTEIISKENLSAQKVADIFSSAFFNVVKDDSDYYVQDNYKIWFSVDEQQNRFIKIETGIIKNDRASELQILQAVNQMNLEYLMITTSYTGKSVKFQYYLWVEGGTATADLILAFRFFTRVLNNLIEELSTLNVLS